MPEELTPGNRELRKWFHEERERALELQRQNFERRLEDAMALLNQRIDANLELTRQVDLAQKDALHKAELVAEKRFEAINEFRGQIADHNTRFVTREVAEQAHVELSNRIQQIQGEYNRRLNSIEQAQAASRTQMLMLGGFVTFIIAVVVIVVNILLSLIP